MDLVQIIEATEAIDGTLRKQAEDQLFQARNQNPASFMLACSQRFNQSNLNEKLRAKAGILIKYTLLNFENGVDNLWADIGQETSTIIKENILNTLFYPDGLIKRIAADLIVIIYGIESSLTKYPSLFYSLIQNTNHHNVEIKKSAIFALGKLCEQFENSKLSMNKDVATKILNCIYNEMQEIETDDIKIVTVIALSDSLRFMRELFDNQNVRQSVVSLLLKCIASTNRIIKIYAMQCLIEFARIYYDYLKDFYVLIWEITSKFIRGKDKELATLGIEVWCTVANEDKERACQTSDKDNVYQKQHLNIIPEVEKYLVPALLDNFLDNSNYEDENSGKQKIISATIKCLISIAKATKESFFKYTIQFIETHLYNKNPVEIIAALLAYICMLHSPSSQLLANKVTQVLLTLATLLVSNQNMLVRKIAAMALKRTVIIIPQAYFNEPLFFSISKDLTTSIDSDPQISIHITKLWYYLGEEIIKNQKFHTFNINFSLVVDLLLNNAFKDLKKNYYILIGSSLLAAKAILLCLPGAEVKAKYIPVLLDKFSKAIQITDERKNLIQTGLLACLQSLLAPYDLKVSKSNLSEPIKEIIEVESSQKAYKDLLLKLDEFKDDLAFIVNACENLKDIKALDKENRYDDIPPNNYQIALNTGITPQRVELRNLSLDPQSLGLNNLLTSSFERNKNLDSEWDDVFKVEESQSEGSISKNFKEEIMIEELPKDSEKFLNLDSSLETDHPYFTCASLTYIPSSGTLGKLVTSGEGDHIEIWDIASKTRDLKFRAYSPNVMQVIYLQSLGKEIIVSANVEGTIYLWDYQNCCKLLGLFEEHEDAVYTLAYIPDSDCMASGGKDRYLKLWQISDQKQIYSRKLSKKSITVICYMKNSKQLAVGDDDGNLYIILLANLLIAKNVILTTSAHQDHVIQLIEVPNSNVLVSGSGNGQIKIWDLSNSNLKCLNAFGGENEVIRSMEIFFDRKLLIANYADQYVKIWTFPGGEEVGKQEDDTFGNGMVAITKTDQIATGVRHRVNLWTLNLNK